MKGANILFNYNAKHVRDKMLNYMRTQTKFLVQIIDEEDWEKVLEQEGFKEKDGCVGFYYASSIFAQDNPWGVGNVISHELTHGLVDIFMKNIDNVFPIFEKEVENYLSQIPKKHHYPTPIAEYIIAIKGNKQFNGHSLNYYKSKHKIHKMMNEIFAELSEMLTSEYGLEAEFDNFSKYFPETVNAYLNFLSTAIDEAEKWEKESKKEKEEKEKTKYIDVAWDLYSALKDLKGRVEIHDNIGIVRTMGDIRIETSQQLNEVTAKVFIGNELIVTAKGNSELNELKEFLTKKINKLVPASINRTLSWERGRVKYLSRWSLRQIK